MTDEEKRRVLEEARAHVDQSWTPERFPPRAAPERSAHVRRTDQPGDLLYRTTENALTEPAEVDAVPSGDRVDPWNEALEHRLEQEREFVLDSVGEALGKYVAKVNAERDAQVNEEFAKIWRSLTMALKQITKIQREKVERAFRTEAIDPNAKMN